jgi:ubiquinone/menaquinone biosynthesis C-methylase UbiE
MKFFGRRAKSREPRPPEPALGKPRRQSRRARLVSTVLLFGVFAVFTGPGRWLVRTFARWADGHIERFTEPESRTYARVVAPVLGRLYNRVAEDVVAELGPTHRGRKPLVLDLGCGPGDLVVTISRRLRDAQLIGLDRSPSMLLWAGRHATTDGRIRFLVGDAGDLPFDDESVDLVVSTLSLHHWSAPTEVLAETARVLKPGGIALLYDLGLLARTPKELARAALDAGIDPQTIELTKAGGGSINRLFVKIRMEMPA